MTDTELLDQIQEIRAKNNVPWMDILRLAFEVAPDRARFLVRQIVDYDQRIHELSERLAENGTSTD